MPREDDPTDVEFVAPDGAPTVDEDLPQPDRRELPGSAAQRRTLAIGAAVLVALAIGARALNGPDPKPAAAGASATAPGSAPAASVSPRGLSATWEVQAPVGDATRVLILPVNGSGLVRAPSGSLVTPAHGPTCPTADLVISCSMTHTASAGFLAAVLDTLPGARTTSFTSVVTHGSGGTAQLEFCRLAAQAGKLHILVQVQHPRVPYNGVEFTSDDGRRTTLYTTHRTDAYTVQVELSGPSGSVLVPDKLDRLVRDPRLLSAT